ncbi:protocadherin Fat 3 [Tachysurus vachellii]|uniref:protocadherin Fat 3 n=1 Tax=Tachysurus vachellii TaxID=175792 RepID=UPI00296B0DE3|nr:protocadherin Fat 3 [Tachysurus vachellii]
MDINRFCGENMSAHLSTFSLLILCLLTCCSQLQPAELQGFQFTRSVYNAAIYENTPARSYLRSEVKMGIILSQSISRDIEYSIMSGDDEGLFEAEKYVLGDFCFLRIHTKGESSDILNREIKDNYTLSVRATINGGLNASTKVSVQVLDMNDLRPLFSPTTYTITVPESTPLGASIAQVTATDADIGSNGEFYYFFKKLVEEFAVHPTSGIIYLTAKPSDDNTKFELEVLAFDRGMKVYENNGVSSAAKVMISIIRVNEFSPTLNVVALAPSLTDQDPVYAVVTVEDLDDGPNGEIEWVCIIEGDPLEQFVLKRAPRDNDYLLKISEPADWNTFPYAYNLTFQAKDRGIPPRFSNTQILHLMVKKPEPVLFKFAEDVYRATINEMAPPGTIIRIVAISPKPQYVTYRLSLTSESTFFTINSFTGVISTVRPFTTLGQQRFELEVVEAVSGLSAKVQITVEDANNNVPTFTQASYKVSVTENTPVDTVILVLSAVDDDHGDNGCITYSIQSLQPLPFTINQNTGELMTSKELDFESSLETYVFLVRASDWGLPYRRESEVNVTVQILNVNDNPPLFERVSCKGIIAQEFTVGHTIITFSAIDIDDLSLVKYKILSGNEQGIFSLNPDTGILSLRKSLVGTNVKNEPFCLKIAATDGELFSDPTFINITVMKGKVSSRNFNCNDTKVEQKIAEQLLKKASAIDKPMVEEGNSDLYSVNRHTPQFESFPSDIVVREDLPVGSTIIKVNTIDKDTGFNARILHVISDGNTDSCFNIDMESGVIYIYQPLDRERSDRYLLNISIYDMGLLQRSNWRLLTVNIDDVNDNSPQFSLESYNAVLPENTAIGTEVIQIVASDIDLDHNGEIFYTLLTHTQLFIINSATGWVYVSGQLDRESLSDITLKIEARDKAERGNQKSSVTSLKVYLEDLNDCPPMFIPKSYSCRVLEDVPVGTVITWLQTQDPDLGLGGRVNYFLTNDFNGTFKVNMESGAVKVAKELDFEKQQFYNLSVVAEDCDFSTRLRSFSYIEVEVVDVNENFNEPVFTEFAVKATVKENSRLGTSVVQVTAKDSDKGKDGLLRYSIKSGSGLGRFFIDEETGVIYTSSILDCERQDSYWLTVYATDQGAVPLSTSIEVYVQVEDVNDNAPLTSEPIYHPYVLENSPKDVSVVRVQASDPDITSLDNHLTYRITAGNPQNFFTINSKTGLITTTSRKLDREQQAEHFLEVTITDGGGVSRQSTVWVIVHIKDENDNTPEFPQRLYCVSLPERDQNKHGNPVYRVFAYDSDEGSNAELTYSIVDGNEDGKFFIDTKTAMVYTRKMVTAGAYDILTIKAMDNGIPQKWSTVQLHVEWIRKPLPLPQALQFMESHYNFTISENAKVFKKVGTIFVQQTETPLWFDITDGTSQEMFYIPQIYHARNCTTSTENYDGATKIQRGMGTIVLVKSLDAEKQSCYNLTVQVTDGTNSATTQVHIRALDYNDNAPMFSQPVYQVSVLENTPVNTEVLRIKATDSDERAKLSYSIHGSVDLISMRMFRIDVGTGVIYTADVLDYEACIQHILTIMVKDQEFPYYRDLARIIVNIEDSNDQSPFFTQTVYDGVVTDASFLGIPVVQVLAMDRDIGRNKELVYSIETGNTGGAFAIDSLSGTISVARELDYTFVGHYILTVRATDGGNPALSATATARIAISLSNFSSPKFTQLEYQAEIPENVPVGAFVTSITALSPSELMYNIVQGNNEKRFGINHYTGVIVTQKSLDFETTSSYILVIQAINMAGIVSNTTLNIQVIDKNDNSPIFQQLFYTGSISEAAPVNSVVLGEDGSPLVIQAIDSDGNQNSLLVFQIVEDMAKLFFTVDSGTGSIRNIATLDYETCNEFFFHVNVRDSGSPELTVESPAKVLIKVLNINDSPPRFSQYTYDAVVLLPTYSGLEVLRVEALDPDMSKSSIYYFADNNLEPFSIDPRTGILTVKNSKLSQDRYCFNIKASDGRYSSTALVTVIVREAMDSGLLFSQLLYSSTVLENTSNISTLMVVSTIGNHLNEPIKYAVLKAGMHFEIGPTSGVIQTTGISFDCEEQEVYELVVEASREYDWLRVARVIVRVQVEDINDNAPEFVGLPYYAAVQVDAQIGSSIFQVSATDVDKGINGMVSYQLEDEYRYFKLNSTTGELSIQRSFVADMSNVKYSLVIIARDAGYPSLFTAVELSVTVVNQAMPVFDKCFYGISVREDIPLSTSILKINGVSPEGQRITFTIVNWDPSFQFDIGFESGVISVIHPLDYETTPYYKLIVRSTDMFTGATSEVDVNIDILDVNDNAPVFEKASYTVTLAENSMPGTTVVQLLATDNESENCDIHYEILSDTLNYSDYFDIDSTTGLIVTACLLDYELIQRYSFIVRATDNGSPSQSSEVMITVLVNDTNDNPPSFNQPLYEAFVNEIAPRGHFVTCVQASDVDISDFDRLRYSILSGDDRMNFLIDPETGVISLSHQRLQRMQQIYMLNVSASDGVFTSITQVNIQILGANLYNPLFSQKFYLAYIQENVPAGAKVIQVRATDEDYGIFGQIMYSFINDLGKTLFAIGADGVITTAQKLDRENPVNRDIVLIVMALDGGGRASFCNVRVILTDENDNAPLFKAAEYRVSIKANIAIGTLVTQIQAQDQDAGNNGKVTYSLYSEARLPLVDVLEIEPDSGWMVTKGSLAHLRGTVLSFFVKATDGGVPSKHSLVSAFIHVLPPDANIPSFTQPQYSYTILEDTPIGTAIGSVYLNPGPTAIFAVVNGETVESNQGKMFIIERETGAVRLDNTLDYELVNIYRFKVSATIREDLVESMYVVDVEVKVLDVNDNKPSFETSSYVAMVMEGIPVGTRVMRVHALDHDWGSNGQVTYSLGSIFNHEKEQTSERASTIDTMFAVDSKTGWITTLGDLDHEICPSYTFTVVASDLGETVSLSSTAVITVAIADINDNPPIFERSHYKAFVRENDPIGEVVSVLSTRDSDTSDQNRLLSLHITGGNLWGVFALASVQGVWMLTVKRPLDREKQDRYLLNITASDSLFASQVTVEVTIMDSNDNSPICNQAIYDASFPEDIPINYGILTVGATDSDIGTNAEIQYSVFGIGVEDFYMDANTGELKTASLIDRERTQNYNLIAQATDGGGLFCRSEIFLTVIDVNDNAPSFYFTEFLASVFENAAPKTLLTRLQAEDVDEGLNRRIMYSLVDSADGVFSINPFSGVIILEKSLDREIQDSYRVRVQAADQAGAASSLSTQVDLFVMVLDVNDNPPVFQKQDYAVTVPEDVAVGTELLRVFASSKDIGVNAEIYYSISTGNEHGKFYIDKTKGSISVADDLDYEVCKEFFLKVEAVDGGTPPQKTSTIISIEVMDVNDNAPFFSEEIYNVLVSEDTAIGQTITRLLAEDLDSQVNGRITYSILRGDQGNQFWIDPVTGLLKVNKALDREKVSSYKLLVQAFDSGSPAMSTTVTVNIDIADVNDNAPVFSPENASAVIQLNKPAGTTILRLSVSDNDSPRNGAPFDFLIVSGNEDNVFTLDRNGELCSNKVFEPHDTREHVLEIQAWDSGKPRLSSSSFVVVRVIGGNVFKPVVFPVEIVIVIVEDVFPGGIIGRIHASDEDENDVLSFKQQPQPKSMFRVDQKDGKIVALNGLEPGRYFINITVSDGHLSETVGIKVQVEMATEEMVQNAVMLRFQDLSPEDFVGIYLKHLKRTLQNSLVGAGMAQTPEAMHIIGVQSMTGSPQLEVLLAVEAQEGGYLGPGELALRLGKLRENLGGTLKLAEVLDQSCSGELDCGDSVCELSLELKPADFITYCTSKMSFILPHFRRTETCTCSGRICSKSAELCEGQVCPPDMQCVRSASTAPSACQCLPESLHQCAGQTSLSFSGNSYIKYRVTVSSKDHGMKVSLKVRTLQNRGVIMYRLTTPCHMLKIEEGHLWFQLDCTNSLDVLGISERAINDGAWHAVALDLTYNYTQLSLDDSYVERWHDAQIPVHLWPHGTNSSLFFGAQVTQSGGHRDLWPYDGFQGCLSAVTLNGNELPLQTKRNRYGELTATNQVKMGCMLYPNPCLGTLCQNGAPCNSLPSGAFSCSCPPQYTGMFCETEVSSCVPTPCRNRGECKAVGNTFLCGCPKGFTGLICEEDVNECDREECENGGACVNTFGGFYCNCTAGFEGQFCGQPSAGVPGTQAEMLSYIGPAEVIGIGVLFFVVMVLLVLLAVFHKKLLRKDWVSAESAGISTENGYPLREICAGAEGTGGPPQVMVRPTAYTAPQCQGEKTAGTHALATVSCPPQLGTFQITSQNLGISRRGVAVCSVAPNLPSLLPNFPLRKPPWEDDEEEDDDDENENEECEAQALKWQDRNICHWADGQEMDTKWESDSSVEEASFFSDSSTSEAHSVRSDFCDDASIVTVIRRVNDAVDNAEKGAYHWEATEWTADTFITDLEATNRQHSPTPHSLPAPLALTPTRLGGSVRLGGSTHSLVTSYPLHRYEGHREFYSSLSRKCPVPVCEECQDEESFLQRSYNEGITNAPCYQSSLREERLHVWKDSPSFGSHREISRIGVRRSFGAQCSHSNQHSPSMSEADQYKHY